MGRDVIDRLPNGAKYRLRRGMSGIQPAEQMREFSQANGGMSARAAGEETIDGLWRPPLQNVKIDARVEEQRSPDRQFPRPPIGVLRPNGARGVACAYAASASEAIFEAQSSRSMTAATLPLRRKSLAPNPSSRARRERASSRSSVSEVT